MKKTFRFCAILLIALLSFSLALSATISLQELRDILLLADGSEAWTGDMDAGGNALEGLLSLNSLHFATEYVDLATAVSTIGATEDRKSVV